MFRKRQSSSFFPRIFRYVVIFSILFCFFTIYQLNNITNNEDLNKSDTLNTPFEPNTDFLKGHTYQELLQLESTWTPTSYYRAPVTVLITRTDNKNDISNLYEQLDAIYSQTVKPESVWIITTKEQEENVNKLLREKRLTGSVQIYIVDVDELGPFAYLQIAQRKIQSKYVMLLKSGVVLGNQYLQNMLYISNTKEYSNKLLSTMGVIINNRPNKSYKVGDISLTCYEDHRSSYFSRDSVKFTRVSRRVDMLTNVWFLQKQWIPILFRELSNKEAFDLPLEFLISFALRYHSNIPSILLPTLNKESWADIRPGSIQTATCNYFKRFLIYNIAWKHYVELGYPFIAEEPSNQNKIMIILDGPDQEKYFRTLYCKLSLMKDYLVSVVTTGSDRELDGSRLRSIIKHEKSCGRVDVYDLNIHTNTSNSDIRNQVYQGFGQMIEYLNPEILIYAGVTKNPIIKGISLAVKGFNEENVYTITEMKLQLEEIEYITGLIIDLPFSALRNWNEPKFQLQVVTQNRPDSLSRLINSLNMSYYFGDNDVSLTINIDRGADPITMEYCSKLQWIHGPLKIRHRVVQGGLLPAIVESYYPHDYNDYGILLEDDVEVSPFFYLWSKYNVLKYRYGPDKYHNQRLFGISLYGQRQMELHLIGRRPYNPESILRNTKFPTRTPYLSQVPCSWGAVYFPEIWKEFHEYVTERVDDETKYHLQNFTVPNSRSYKWRKSWKKFLIELVYLRGYTMLYPNFKSFTSFSTNHAEYGIHLHNRTGKPDPVTIFGVPLMKEFTLFKELPDQHLPDFVELPVTDLWGNLTTFNELINRGINLHNEISLCPPNFKREDDMLNFSPRDILCVDEESKRDAIRNYKNSEKQNTKVLLMYKTLKEQYQDDKKVNPMKLLSELIQPHLPTP